MRVVAAHQGCRNLTELLDVLALLHNHAVFGLVEIEGELVHINQFIYFLLAMPSAIAEAHANALANPDYDFITRADQFNLVATRIKEFKEFSGPIGVDTETGGLEFHSKTLELIQLATSDYCLIIDVRQFADDDGYINFDFAVMQLVKDFLQSDKPKVFTNSKFDLNFLRFNGIHCGGRLFDTQVAAKVINAGTGAKNGLADQVPRYLKVEIDKSSQKDDWTIRPLSDDQLKYAARDAISIVRLASTLVPLCEEKELTPTLKFDLNCLRPIAEMSFRGMPFNLDKAERLKTDLELAKATALHEWLTYLDQLLVERRMEPLPRNEDGTFNTNAKTVGSIRLGTKVYKGFNPASVIQVRESMLNLGVRLPYGKNGTAKVDQDTLKLVRLECKDTGDVLAAQIELITRYLEYKQQETLLKHINTLLKAADGSWRIYCSYNQSITDTGRLSASGPNLQQIPKDKMFRELFEAPPGWVLVVADYSQIELRVAAELSQEPNMLEAFRNNIDLHTKTARLMLGLRDDEECPSNARKPAKIANFGMLFGAMAGTLRRQAVSSYDMEWSQEYAEEVVKMWHASFPELKKWQEETGNRTTAAIYTLTGRRRLTLPGTRGDKFTVRLNTPIQGTAGDITKSALIKLWQKIWDKEDEALLISTVHDEIILQVREEHANKWKDILKETMEEAGNEILKSVPVVAEAGVAKTWAEAK